MPPPENKAKITQLFLNSVLHWPSFANFANECIVTGDDFTAHLGQRPEHAARGLVDLVDIAAAGEGFG
jgi:hypothetical protein